LPYPFPPLDLLPKNPYRGLTPDAYARVLTDTAPVYRHPADALAGLPPVRAFEHGFEFVSLVGEVSVVDQTFYQINPGEFMRAEHLQEVRPSGFQGRFFDQPPAGPVGWMINTVPVSAAPGLPGAEDAPRAGRYQQFDLLETARV